MTMKRWIWIPAMAPVMWALWRLVLSADRLHAWHYSESYPPPAPADYTYAAFAFWTALLTPAVMGLVAAVMAFRRKHPPCWPAIEIVIVAIPYLAMGIGSLTGVLYESNSAADACWLAIMWACLFVGGAIVVTLLNLGACMRQRMWGKFALSAGLFCAGTLYLFWLNSFIIYIDT